MEICGYSSQGNTFKTILDQSAVNKMNWGQMDKNNKNVLVIPEEKKYSTWKGGVETS